ncbi:unnamed protein product [Calicophoron daubneyi]|uniref:KASH domain-containing protein n=1 Tax=Calicophoron daubneyi TaxID=300641 RepID=A0AAV2TJV2_CALDB
MDEDIIKECDIADECDLRKSPNKNSPSLEYCVSHAQNLYSWLQRIKNRVKNRRRIHAEKYATSPFLIELQQNEQRKRALFELISVTIPHTVLGDRSTRDAVNDEGTPVNESGVAERDRDTESGIHGLVRLVEQIQREWNDLLVHLQPIDPMEHKQMLFEDVQSDLDEVANWLNMLQPNLPGTAVWMTSLKKLTDVQRRSASKYYKTHLKHIERYSRTLSLLRKLMDACQKSESSERSDADRSEKLLQSIGHLESICHMQWLRLLELTVYLDQAYFQEAFYTTDLAERSSQGKTKEFLKPAHTGPAEDAIKIRQSSENLGYFPVAEQPVARNSSSGAVRSSGHWISSKASRSWDNITSNDISSPINLKEGPESGFESELSPQPKHLLDFVRRPGEYEGDKQKFCNDLWSSWPTTLREAAVHRRNTDNSNPEDYKDFLRMMNSEQTKSPLPSTDRPLRPTRKSSKNSIINEEENCPRTVTTNENMRRKRSRKLKRPNRRKSTCEKELVCTNSFIEASEVERQADHSEVSDKSHLLINSTSEASSFLSVQPDPSVPIHTDNSAELNDTSSWSIPTADSLRRAKEATDKKFKEYPKAEHGKPRTTNKEDDHNGDEPIINFKVPNGAISPKNNNKFEDAESIEHFTGPAENAVLNALPNSLCKIHIYENHPDQRIRTRQVRRRKSYLQTHRPRRRLMSDLLSQRSRGYHHPMVLRKCVPDEYKKCKDCHQAVDSRSSSLDGDASEVEQKRWKRRVRSYLDVAAQTEAMVRRQYEPATLNSWLKRLSPQLNSQTPSDCTSSADETNATEMNLKTAPEDTDLTNVRESKVDDTSEQLMNCWDYYQAPLYSSSNESESHEPVSTYAEEFPWDDVGGPSSGEESHKEPYDKQVAQNHDQHSQYIPFQSLAISKVNEGSSDAQQAECIPVARQDTMELSTSTSVLFNQKSSMEASFEVCSHSAGFPLEPVFQSEITSTPAQLLNVHETCELRTHPDGGSQQQIDRDLSGALPELSPCIKSEYCARTLAYDASIDPTASSLLLRAIGVPPYARTSSMRAATFLDSTQIPQDMYSKRRCRTLPRAAPKRHTPARLVPNTAADKEWINRNHLSSCVSLDELAYLQANNQTNDLLKISERKFTEINIVYHSLLAAPVLSGVDRHTRGELRCLTAQEWQNSLSEIVHAAEWNLQFLTSQIGDLTNSQMGWKGATNTAVKNDPDSNSPTKPNCRLRDSARMLQMKWMDLIHQARYRLLHSCSGEALREELCNLKARMNELNKLVEQLSGSMALQANSYLQPENFESRFTFSSAETSKQNEDLLREEIKQCLLELDKVFANVQRLRKNLERHSSTAHNQGELPTSDQSTLVSSSISKLSEELDALTVQLTTNQLLLSKLVQSKDALLVDEHADSRLLPVRHTDTKHSAEMTPSRRHNLEKTTCLKELSKSSISAVGASALSKSEKQKHQYYMVLITGGLVAFTCFCYYVLTRLFTCVTYPVGWRGSLATLQKILGLPQTGLGNCPLRREKLSDLVDYSQGSVPF